MTTKRVFRRILAITVNGMMFGFSLLGLAIGFAWRALPMAVKIPLAIFSFINRHSR